METDRMPQDKNIRMTKKVARVWCTSLVAITVFWLGAGVKAAPQEVSAPTWPSLGAKTHKKQKSGLADISAVQYLLRARGFYRGAVDGIYGSQTVAAVKAFQKSRKLRVDGIAGPQTLSALVIKVRRGSKGDAVRAVQVLLRSMPDLVEGKMVNRNLPIDGVFGVQTEKALLATQGDFNLTKQQLVEDGIMGPNTWRQMLRFASEQD